jgi:SAM-dependent methyltransferase
MGQARYDTVAESYGAGPDDYSVSATTSLLEFVGDVEGHRVLDLACGHGLIARELARRHASVVGADLSVELLARGRDIEAVEPLGISYVHADVSAADTLEGREFDGVVCNFGLSDIDDLDGACATVARLLVPGGWFVFCILHPCFGGGANVSGSWRTGGRYYDEEWWKADGELSVLRREVGANHRTLSTYINSLCRHGLIVERMAEPPPNESWATTRPDAASYPVYLVVRCTRADTAALYPR